MGITRVKTIAAQLKDILRQRILQGEYRPDSRIPSEIELAAEFGVSRSSIRNALSALASERIIIRRPGDGTYINERILKLTLSPGNIWEFSRHIEATGRKASIRSLSAEKRSATDQEALALDLHSGDEVIEISNLFLADNRPVALANNVLPTKLMVQEVDLQATQVSFDEFVRKYCLRELSYTIIEISAILADRVIADFLRINQQSPLLCIDAVFFDEFSHPVADTVSYYCDKASRIRIPITLD